MENIKVAIQGIKGSYHHQVAQLYFNNPAIEVEECLSFSSLVDCITTKDTPVAVMAIENSIAGSIIPNYAYIDQYNLPIVGEYYLSIHHCLMALEGQNLSDIKEVYSHPMALLQCKKFFSQYPHIKLVEDVDTAAISKRIQDYQLSGVAAIASQIAAEIYGLSILARDIQTIKTNSTRFFILDTRKDSPLLADESINKVSLKLICDHKQGSLATILNVMSNCSLNLTKIQSLPVIEKPWKYAFFIDVSFQDYKDYQKAMSILKIMALDIKVLGSYKTNLIS